MNKNVAKASFPEELHLFAEELPIERFDISAEELPPGTALSWGGNCLSSVSTVSTAIGTLGTFACLY